PAAVGVSLRRPVAESTAKPGGAVPPAIDHDVGGRLPVEVSANVNGLPTSDAGAGPLAAAVRGVDTASVSACVTLRGPSSAFLTLAMKPHPPDCRRIARDRAVRAQCQTGG